MLISTVREARRVRNVKIVSIDWLEDSLLSKGRRPKREGPYLWSKIVKNGKRKATEKKERRMLNKEPAAPNMGRLSGDNHISARTFSSSTDSVQPSHSRKNLEPMLWKQNL